MIDPRIPYANEPGLTHAYFPSSKPINPIFEHTCAYAQWALMHHFLSVRPSICDWTKIKPGQKVTRPNINMRNVLWVLKILL